MKKKVLTALVGLCAATALVPSVGVHAEETGPVAEVMGVQYDTLQEAIDNAQMMSNNIKLLRDVENGDGVKFNEGIRTKMYNIDLNGFTYDIGPNLVGSTGTETLGMQILKRNAVTLRNGKVTSDDAKMLIQNYGLLYLDNVTLENKNPSNERTYVVSNNNGLLEAKDSKILTNKDDVAFDAYYWSKYYPDGVSVTLVDTEVVGDVEYDTDGYLEDYSDKLMMSMEDCTVDGNLVVPENLEDANISLSGGSYGNDVSAYAPENYLAGLTEEGVYILYPEHDCNDTYLVGKKEATVDEEGYTGDTYCSEYKVLLEKGETIPVLEDDDEGDTPAGGGDSSDEDDKDETGLDYTKLLEAANRLDGVNLDLYTEESVAKLQKAIEAYNDLMEKEDVTQQELDAVVEDIDEAIDGLVLAEKDDDTTGKTEGEEGTTGSTQKPGGVNTGDPTNAGGLAAMLLGSLGVLLKKRK